MTIVIVLIIGFLTLVVNWVYIKNTVKRMTTTPTMFVYQLSLQRSLDAILVKGASLRGISYQPEAELSQVASQQFTVTTQSPVIPGQSDQEDGHRASDESLIESTVRPLTASTTKSAPKGTGQITSQTTSPITSMSTSRDASYNMTRLNTREHKTTDDKDTEGSVMYAEGEVKKIMETIGATVDTRSRTNPCPENPPGLIGETASNMTHVTKTELLETFPDIRIAGHLRPSNCTPLQKVALVVPYRNRWEHLQVLLHNLIPFLARQMADIRLFIIEQAGNSKFNRGALLNVGFLEADKFDHFDCYIFHDVDMIPRNDHNLYRCGDSPRHFAVALSRYDYKILYHNFFGGVVGLTRDQYLKVNGNSNLYTGWGGEDDDLLARVQNKNFTTARYDVNTAKYDTFNHSRDEGNEVNPLRYVLLKYAQKRQDVEGLNTVQYKVLGVKVELLYTWITVSLNNSQLVQNAPSYMEEYWSSTNKIFMELQAGVRDSKICGASNFELALELVELQTINWL
ncbi:Beta-1,4-galactosyltransferase 5 [Bulinus truncatus]|nr:Beta-1,4-galactosyltransferase 5 [Bulinus truncatus]